MKSVKMVTAALGLAFVISVFLPFVSVEGMSMSLWQAKAFKSAPTYMILVGGLIVLGLSALAIRGRLGRGLAAGITFGSLIVALISVVQFNGHHGMGSNFSLLMDQGAIGAKILVFGGMLALVAGIAALVKPEPRS